MSPAAAPPTNNDAFKKRPSRWHAGEIKNKKTDAHDGRVGMNAHLQHRQRADEKRFQGNFFGKRERQPKNGGGRRQQQRLRPRETRGRQKQRVKTGEKNAPQSHLGSTETSSQPIKHQERQHAGDDGREPRAHVARRAQARPRAEPRVINGQRNIGDDVAQLVDRPRKNIVIERIARIVRRGSDDDP